MAKPHYNRVSDTPCGLDKGCVELARIFSHLHVHTRACVCENRWGLIHLTSELPDLVWYSDARIGKVDGFIVG